LTSSALIFLHLPVHPHPDQFAAVIERYSHKVPSVVLYGVRREHVPMVASGVVVEGSIKPEDGITSSLNL